jgi:hypothetical protein
METMVRLFRRKSLTGLKNLFLFDILHRNEQVWRGEPRSGAVEK